MATQKGSERGGSADGSRNRPNATREEIDMCGIRHSEQFCSDSQEWVLDVG